LDLGFFERATSVSDLPPHPQNDTTAFTEVDNSSIITNLPTDGDDGLVFSAHSEFPPDFDLDIQAVFNEHYTFGTDISSSTRPATDTTEVPFVHDVSMTGCSFDPAIQLDTPLRLALDIQEDNATVQESAALVN
jgi:hypothetical protein